MNSLEKRVERLEEMSAARHTYPLAVIYGGAGGTYRIGPQEYASRAEAEAACAGACLIVNLPERCPTGGRRPRREDA